MLVYLLGGEKTNKIVEVLDGKSGMKVLGKNNLSDALAEIKLTEEPNQVVILDYALFNNGKQLNTSEVIEALKSIAYNCEQIEFLLITKNKELYNKYFLEFDLIKNVRYELMETLNSISLINAILAKEKEKKSLRLKNLYRKK